ncbi:MAG: hypothetical protein ACXADF_17690 [Candidatus Thorarchaeota archaeon]
MSKQEGKTGVTTDANSCLREISISSNMLTSDMDTLHTFLAPSAALTYDDTTAVTACVVDDGGVQTTDTTDANDAGANDVEILPATPAVNDAFYIGMDLPLPAIKLNIGTAGVGTWTITWEYYDGSSWTALSGVIDDTTGFTVAGSEIVSWTIPPDWATTTVNSIADLYWVRGRVSAYTNVNAQPLLTQAWVMCEYPNIKYVVDGNIDFYFPCVIIGEPSAKKNSNTTQLVSIRFKERTY